MKFFMREKQYGRFSERLASWMFWAAGAGGAWVLIDPYIALQTTIAGIDWSFKIGGVPFSAELKGAVVTIGILGIVGGLQNHWFPPKESPTRGVREPQPEAPKE